jgi:hypothetical protein
MRATALSLLLAVGLTACGRSFSSDDRPRPWKTAFWHWGGVASASLGGEPLDSLYVHVGGIREIAPGSWRVFVGLPDDLPPAKEYWLVVRGDQQGVPPSTVAADIELEVAKAVASARTRKLPIAGIQLDIDCPTGSLAQYAELLRDLKKALPPGTELSITALLDWFRAGTAIDRVVREVSEFVPQFYDTDLTGGDGLPAIATPIDAARWGPAFNRFGKPFRVGISTFGRSRVLRRATAGSGNPGAPFYGDLLPLSVSGNPAFELRADRNKAAEVVVIWRAVRKTRIGYQDIESGDTVQFVLPTSEAVRSAADAARRMSGHLAGVVFFRWPSPNEPLTLQPDEVLAAAGLRASGGAPSTLVHAVEAGCAAVSCVDLYFESREPYSGNAAQFRIRSSSPLDYFLPEREIRVRMAGASSIEVSLPPYCARGRIYLGRAVSTRKVDFTIERQP